MIRSESVLRCGGAMLSIEASSEKIKAGPACIQWELSESTLTDPGKPSLDSGIVSVASAY